MLGARRAYCCQICVTLIIGLRNANNPAIFSYIFYACDEMIGISVISCISWKLNAFYLKNIFNCVWQHSANICSKSGCSISLLYVCWKIINLLS